MKLHKCSNKSIVQINERVYMIVLTLLILQNGVSSLWSCKVIVLLKIFSIIKEQFYFKINNCKSPLVKFVSNFIYPAEYSLILGRRGCICTIVCRKLNSCSANSFNYGGKCPVKTIFPVQFLKCSLQKSLLNTIYTLWSLI